MEYEKIQMFIIGILFLPILVIGFLWYKLYSVSKQTGIEMSFPVVYFYIIFINIVLIVAVLFFFKFFVEYKMRYKVE